MLSILMRSLLVRPPEAGKPLKHFTGVSLNKKKPNHFENSPGLDFETVGIELFEVLRQRTLNGEPG